jgi:uridine kinase
MTAATSGGSGAKPPQWEADDAATLAENELLARLAEPERATFTDTLDQVAVTRGSELLHEGDPGEYMYFVLEGEACVRRGGLEVQRLAPGDHCGELALVGVRPRAASVEALSAMRLARLSRARYVALQRTHPLVALHFVQGLVTALGDQLASMTDSVGVLLTERTLPRRSHVRVRVAGETAEREVASGTTIGALLPREAASAMVVAGLLDHRPVSLGTSVVSDARVAPLTVATTAGRDVYRRSVGLALLAAGRRVAPEIVLRLGPRVGAGQVVLVDGEVGDARDLARALERAVKQLVASDAPMQEEVWSIEEARAYLAERGWDDASALLATWREGTVALVRCGDVHALASRPMLPRCGLLGEIAIRRHPAGLLVDLGDAVARHLPGAVATTREEVLAREQAMPRFGGPMVDEHRRWLDGMGVRDVGTYNQLCVSGQVSQLIRVAEGFQEKGIGRLADLVAARRDSLRIISIAGPSSSGKTTSIKRLSVQLEINGIRPVSLSLDDYFIDRERVPRDESGDMDFEALEALDLELLRDHVRRLLAGETVKTARYDFISGKSLRDAGPELRLGAGSVVLLEGIHGLNPALLGDVAAGDRIFRVFVHPATTLPFDRLTRIEPSDVRLLRRIVRDRRHRGYSAADNILRWPSVQRGEELHIYPFQSHADAIFDTSLVYEVSVLKVYADRYLLEVPNQHEAYSTAYRLRHLLDRFVTIYPDHIPPTSILREFVGGSGFEY